MKLVILDGYTENPGDLSWADIEQMGKLTVYDYTAPCDIQKNIGGAEIVLTNKTPLSREIIEANPQLQYIGVLATGYNVVDVQAARQHGIVVSNVPTYGTTAVAQYVFALLLELCHHVGHHNAEVQSGRWTAGRDFCFWDYPLIELSGKTLGIIGYGRIGRATAAIGRAFGMKICAYDLMAKDPECVPLEMLLKQSDVISLHCPLTKENAGMINRKTIDLMKENVMIINTARGPLINEQDLRDAILNGKVSGAAMDVVSTEPITKDNPLLGLPQCLITPHIAWAPKESRARLMNVAADNLRAFLAGRPVNNVAI